MWELGKRGKLGEKKGGGGGVGEEREKGGRWEERIEKCPREGGGLCG